MSSQFPSFNHANEGPEASSRGAVREGNDKSSKNPYHHEAAVEAPLPRSVSQETQSSVPGRQKPVRAVFHDLPTAHSSITSGSARGRPRALSNNLSEAYDQEDSIPLQEFDPPKRKYNPTPAFLQELPLPPPPAAIVQHRYNSHSNNSDSCLATEDIKFASEQPAKHTPISGPAGQPNSLFANVKNAFAALSSPTDISTSSNWPGNSRDKGKQRAQYPLNGSSVYHSSLAAPPSGSLPPNSIGKRSEVENYTHPRKHAYDSYNAVIPFPDLGRTPAPNERSPALPRQSSKTTRALSNAASSLPEGSTVGNIYKHYVRSEIFDDPNSEAAHSEFDLADGYPMNQNFSNHAVDTGAFSTSLSKGQQHQSALNLRKQRRAERLGGHIHGQPPGCALPGIPNPAPHLPPSSSQGIGHSSSYGDAQNLLDFTEPSLSHWTGHQPNLTRPNGRSDLAFPELIRNNPYRINHGRQVLITRAYEGDGVCHHGHHHNRAADRQPLEREVSEALRRASNFSAYSNGSIATSVLEQYGQFQSEASTSGGLGILRRHIENTLPSEPDLDEETRAAAAQAQAFYDRGAIPSGWITNHQQNLVRVPIQHHDPFPDSPPISPEDHIDAEEVSPRSRDVADDANDWETVGESAFGTDFKGSIQGMLGGGVHRAGSSIANTSDEGTTSTEIPEISNYGSSERIAQHPGNIQYFGDYRQRDLKNSNIPVFLPVFGEHKVNGYLADSNRLRAPRNPFNYDLRPLDRKHTNPFNSPPPEVMKKGSGNKPHASINRDRRAPKPNYFPPSASKETSPSSDKGDIPEQQLAPSHRTRRKPAAESLAQSFTWMDDFGDPGPAINYSNQTFLKPIPHVVEEEDRPSSWQHIMTFARGDSVKGYNPDGTRIVEGSPLGHGFMKEHSFSGNPFTPAIVDLHGKVQNDDFVEQKLYSGKKGPNTLRERNTLVKGPPGAFYHGLSRPKTHRSQSHDVEATPKVKIPYRQSSARNYPTNALRPLSLVPSRQVRPRPATPIENYNDIIDPDPSLSAGPNDFVYRSPLAPPKRKTWQELYTEEQMAGFRQAAKADGFRESRVIDLNAGLLGDGTRESIREGSSRKHLWEEPRLFQFSRELSGVHTNQHYRKKKISIIVLLLCNLFPPLLLLYAIGRLDGIIGWWTSGDYLAFSRPQKRAATWCLVGWFAAVLLALIIFLICWFINH